MPTSTNTNPTIKKIKVGSAGEIDINDDLRKDLEREYQIERQKRISAGQSVDKMDNAFNSAMGLLAAQENGLSGINSAGLFYGTNVGDAEQKAKFKRKVFGIKNDSDYMKESLGFISNFILNRMGQSNPTASPVEPMTQQSTIGSQAPEVPIATPQAPQANTQSLVPDGVVSTPTTTPTSTNNASQAAATGSSGSQTVDTTIQEPATTQSNSPAVKLQNIGLENNYTYDGEINAIRLEDGSYIYTDNAGNPISEYIHYGNIGYFPEQLRGLVYKGKLLKDITAYRKSLPTTLAQLEFDADLQNLKDNSKKRLVVDMPINTRRNPLFGHEFWDNRSNFFPIKGGDATYSVVKLTPEGFWDREYILTDPTGKALKARGYIRIDDKGRYYYDLGKNKRLVLDGLIDLNKLSKMRDYITYNTYKEPNKVTKNQEGGIALNMREVKNYKDWANARELDKKSSAMTSSFGKDYTLTDEDKADLAGLALDVSGVVTSFIPGASVVSGLTGMGGTAALTYAAAKRKGGFDADLAKDTAISLGLDAISMIPIAGSAGKFGKIVKTVKRISPWLLRSFELAGAAGAVAALTKLATGDASDMRLEDWKLLAQGLQATMSYGKHKVRDFGINKKVNPNMELSNGLKVLFNNKQEAEKAYKLQKEYSKLSPEDQAGSKGTAIKQELEQLNVSNPNLKFENKKIAGVIPVNKPKIGETVSTSLYGAGEGRWYNRAASKMIEKRTSPPKSPKTGNANSASTNTTPLANNPSLNGAQSTSTNPTTTPSTQPVNNNTQSTTPETTPTPATPLVKKPTTFRELGASIVNKGKKATTNAKLKAQEATSNLRERAKNISKKVKNNSTSTKPDASESVNTAATSSTETTATVKIDNSFRKLPISEKISKLGDKIPKELQNAKKGDFFTKELAELLRKSGFTLNRKGSGFILKAQEGTKVALAPKYPKPKDNKLSFFKELRPENLAKLGIQMGTNYMIHKLTQKDTPMAVTQNPINLKRINKAGISLITPYMEYANLLENTRNNQYSDAKLNAAQKLSLHDKANELRSQGFNALLDTNLKIDQANTDIANKENISNAEAIYRNKAANAARQQLLLDDKKALLGKTSNALQTFIAEGQMQKGQKQLYLDQLAAINSNRDANNLRNAIIDFYRKKYAKNAEALNMDIDLFLNQNSAVRSALQKELDLLNFDTLVKQLNSKISTFAKGGKFEEKIALAKYRAEVSSYNALLKNSNKAILEVAKANTDGIIKASKEKELIKKMLGL